MLRAKINETAASRVRYGYRRIGVLLRRYGFKINDKRVYRLYGLEGLSLRAKLPHRRRAALARSQRHVAENVNEVWSMGFMHDRLADSRPYRLLTIVDIYSRGVRCARGGTTLLLGRRRDGLATGLPRTWRS